MRNLNLKIFCCLVFLLAVCACKTAAQSKTGNGIKKVRFTQVGGKKTLGDLGIEISKDSTFFKEESRILIREKTSIKLWNRLLSSATVKELSVIKSSESRNYVDESDNFYEIETVNKKYSFLNGIISKKQKRVLAFKSIIDYEFARLIQMFMETAGH
jgi:hypothetical protein